MGRLHKVADILAIGGMVLVLIVAGIISLDVIFRWSLAMPLQIRADFEKVVMAVALACGFPLILLRDKAIVVRLASRVMGRWSILPRLFGILCSALFFGICAWQMARYSAETARAGESLATIDLPIWPFWTAITIALALTIVAALASVLGRWRDGEGA